MDVRVFVSSTCRDMMEDCRPAVLGAIAIADDVLQEFKAGRAAPVAMETWDADYQVPLELCLEKIKADSTHYVGVLGYLRGFVPDQTGGSTMSITEAELDHAIKHRGRRCIAVFVPRDDSSIARELQERAAALQSDAELEAQLDFHAHVLHEGTAQPFTDIADLNGRVVRKVVLWAKGGLREAARSSHRVDDPAPQPRRPASSDLSQLGRRDQLDAFMDRLQRLTSTRVKNAAAFIVYGPSGFGQSQLLARLVHAIEEHAFQQPGRYVVSAGAMWREAGPAPLLHALGREIRAGWRPVGVPELVAELTRLLHRQDVVLQFPDLHWYEGGPAAFFRDLWRPLIDALPDDVTYRLLCLTSVETDNSELDIDEPVGDEAQPGAPVVLPRLTRFTGPELSLWLHSRLPPPRADLLSERLIEVTNGVPHVLYAVLADDALWVTDEETSDGP